MKNTISSCTAETCANSGDRSLLLSDFFLEPNTELEHSQLDLVPVLCPAWLCLLIKTAQLFQVHIKVI